MKKTRDPLAAVKPLSWIKIAKANQSDPNIRVCPTCGQDVKLDDDKPSKPKRKKLRIYSDARLKEMKGQAKKQGLTLQEMWDLEDVGLWKPHTRV